MRKRTRARELALHILYQAEITKGALEDILESFWQLDSYGEKPASREIKEFASSLVLGVRQNISLLDEKISRYATNWQIERIAIIERNILRIGSYELMYRQDIPPKVSINEAVELAKIYSGQEAGKFVNAILDKIKEEARR